MPLPVFCGPQEEGDDDLMFKMVFVVNMDLAMGVGKVSLFFLYPKNRPWDKQLLSVHLSHFYICNSVCMCNLGVCSIENKFNQCGSYFEDQIFFLSETILAQPKNAELCFNRLYVLYRWLPRLDMLL